jgi:transposase
MRGSDTRQEGMFSYVSPESRIPKDHPLRPIREMVDDALKELSADFDVLYSRTGRPSIAPEKLIRALLLQVFYSIRSERLLMEQLEYNLLFRWFVGLNTDDPVWVPTVFTHNRDRLLEGEIVTKFLLYLITAGLLPVRFFGQVLAQAEEKGLTSDEHFSVDGTMIEAWASMKSFRPKGAPPPAGGGRNTEVDFRGEKRCNDTHESYTDPDCRLYRKSEGQQAKLCYLGHLMMENRNGFIVEGQVTPASGSAEREAAAEMVEALPGERRKTLGADKAYDTAEFVASLRGQNVTPHVAQNTTRPGGSAIDARTTRHEGYTASLEIRKLIETRIGWVKEIGGLRKAKLRGLARLNWKLLLSLTAFNLLHLRNVLAGIEAAARHEAPA